MPGDSMRMDAMEMARLAKMGTFSQSAKRKSGKCRKTSLWSLDGWICESDLVVGAMSRTGHVMAEDSGCLWWGCWRDWVWRL